MKTFIPFWEQTIVQDETLVFAEESGVISAHLAFDNPKNIVVYTREGQTLTLGKDYALDGNSVVLLNTALPHFKEGWLQNIGVPDAIPNENARYKIEDCLLVEPVYLRGMQLFAKYEHSSARLQGVLGDRLALPKTYKLLREKKRLKIALMGDSISNAANSSWEMGFEGYEHWFSPVVSYLGACFDTEIEFVNVSRSGYGTDWALTAVDEKFENQNADLAIVAFGMNDGTAGMSVEQFTANTALLLDKIRAHNKNTEFILIATPVPNLQCNFYKAQKDYIHGLRTLEKEGVTVLNMTAIFNFLLEKKRYCEISGNNMNHPNDFGYAFYTDACKALFDTLHRNERIKSLSVAEKITLLTGSGGMEAVDLGAGAMLRMADGPLGVKTKNGKTVCFPNTCLTACSFDRELCNEIGVAMGAEAKRLGVNLLLAPAINIKRNPLAGRNFEYYSEDPYVTGALAIAFVKGIHQSGVGVCVKHFACNNQETLRWVQDSIVDDDTIRNIYLKAFEMLVSAGEADSIMASYNSVNGVQMNENKYLLDGILRKEWGYQGVVISDWASVDNLVDAVNSGLDLEMSGNAPLSVPELTEAYEKGILTEETIDTHAGRLLALADRLNENTDAIKDGLNLARLRKLTGECFVLLKNEGVLPFSKYERVLLVGESAVRPRIQGGGCAMLHQIGEKAQPLHEISARCTCSYMEDYTLAGVDKQSLREYDKIVVFLSLPEDRDSEAIDRKDLCFPQEQLRCIKALREYNENIVAVMSNGSAVDTSFATEVKGLLETYYAGDSFAGALADVLFGDTVPSGKLAESFPARLADIPSVNDFGKRTVVYREREFVGYRYYASFDVKTAYPFGFGLSYCHFAITNISIDRTDDYAFTLACDIENQSDYEGKEVLQVYLRTATHFEPKMRLLEFTSVRLAPREKKRVEIKLDRSHFAYYTGGKKRTYEGEYSVCLARSSEDILEEKGAMFCAYKKGAFDENTLMGELLGDTRYREILLKYTREAINLWAYGDAETDENFEDDTFLRMHVYDMPIRGIAYFSAGKLNPQTVNALLAELNEKN